MFLRSCSVILQQRKTNRTVKQVVASCLNRLENVRVCHGLVCKWMNIVIGLLFLTLRHSERWFVHNETVRNVMAATRCAVFVFKLVCLSL